MFEENNISLTIPEKANMSDFGRKTRGKIACDCPYTAVLRIRWLQHKNHRLGEIHPESGVNRTLMH